MVSDQGNSGWRPHLGCAQKTASVQPKELVLLDVTMVLIQKAVGPGQHVSKVEAVLAKKAGPPAGRGTTRGR